MNVRKDLPVLAILMTAVAAPAAGQTAAPAAATSATANAAIPDFSGAWAHPGIGFGLPLSGPGPVRNKSRTRTGASNPDQLVGDYSNPILKPETAAILKKLGEISLSGRAFPDPDSQCLQNPVPYIFWNFYLRLLQQPGKVTLVYQHDDDFRQVRLNQPHPANVVPSVQGIRSAITKATRWSSTPWESRSGRTGRSTVSARRIRRPCTWSSATA
jgi:hypothetical protein